MFELYVSLLIGASARYFVCLCMYRCYVRC